MIKRVILVVVMALALAACGARYESVRLRDTQGKEHECIVYHRGYKGGISCDWGNH